MRGRGFSGRRLRELRTAAGLTRRELAGHIGRSKSIVTDYEHGRVTPSVVVLDALAATLHCTIDDLFAPSDTGLRISGTRR